MDAPEYTDLHRQVFDKGMEVLDATYAPPLLWQSAKYSSWYAVGLLARAGPGDVDRANALLENCLAAQDVDPSFEAGFGTFKNRFDQPLPSGPDPVWTQGAYDGYDMNNALFLTMGTMVADAEFSHLLEPELRPKLYAAMHKAMQGNAKRGLDFHGDNMHESYSNPYLLRCACTAYVANLVNDSDLAAKAEQWARAAVTEFDKHDTPGEFNSPTYAGVTLMALSLAKYCPPSSLLAKEAPRIIGSLWDSLAEVYNPTLRNIAGPWDRTYGFCMTRYFATIGCNIAALTGLEAAPMPTPLMGSEHVADVAIIPITMLVAPYTESTLTPEARAKFTALKPHTYTPTAYSGHHDHAPRNYTFHLADGLNVGGMGFDEDVVGGPNGNPYQFVPGVIQWDAGRHGGGCGWIAVWPEGAAADIAATPGSLRVAYKRPTPGGADGHAGGEVALPKSITLHIGCMPYLQLDANAFATGEASLPGLDVKVSGNVVERGERRFTFTKEQVLHGVMFYKLSYVFPRELWETEEPALLIEFSKTTPPVYPLRFAP